MAKGASKPGKGTKKAPSKDKAAKEKKVYQLIFWGIYIKETLDLAFLLYFISSQK